MATKVLPIMTDATGQKIANAIGNVTAAAARRNMGELVFSSVPLADACLVLADGRALSRGAYSDFYDYIASLATTQNPAVITGTSAGTGANIGKYVYDSTNQRVFLPNLNNLFIEGNTDSSLIGSYVPAGAPEIEGKIKDFAYTSLSGKSISDYTGAFTRNDGSQGQTCSWGSGSLTMQVINFNASLSNSIYGSSNTIQPPAVKQYIYVVVANSYKAPVIIDIDNVMTDINNITTDINNINSAITSLNTATQYYYSPSELTLNTTYIGTSSSVRVVKFGNIVFMYCVIEIKASIPANTVAITLPAHLPKSAVYDFGLLTRSNSNAVYGSIGTRWSIDSNGKITTETPIDSSGSNTRYDMVMFIYNV